MIKKFLQTAYITTVLFSVSQSVGAEPVSTEATALPLRSPSAQPIKNETLASAGPLANVERAAKTENPTLKEAAVVPQKSAVSLPAQPVQTSTVSSAGPLANVERSAKTENPTLKEAAVLPQKSAVSLPAQPVHTSTPPSTGPLVNVERPVKTVSSDREKKVPSLEKENTRLHASEVWIIQPNDGTLRRALNRWAAQAGWQVAWEAAVDLPVTVTARFQGDFREALQGLFGSLSAADVNLSVLLYNGNRVARVIESGQRAQ